MRKMRFVLLAVVTLLLLVPSGCGSTTGDTGEKADSGTLEEYMAAHEEAAAEIEKDISKMGSDMMIPSIAYEGNSVVMTMTLRETFDDEEVTYIAEAFEETMEEEGVGEVMAADAQELSDSTGIGEIKANVVLCNGDGSEIWSKVYPE